MSAIKDRRIYTKEFKEDALNLSKSPGYTLSLAARKLGIAEKNIYRWRKEQERNGHLAFPGNGKPSLTEDQIRIKELEKQLRDSELENAILKKAVGIFSRAPQ
jgi:transposase